jgi:hypothetical protein
VPDLSIIDLSRAFKVEENRGKWSQIVTPLLVRNNSLPKNVNMAISISKNKEKSQKKNPHKKRHVGSSLLSVV